MKKISGKITEWSVDKASVGQEPKASNSKQELIQRPDKLIGCTYKIKSPHYSYAMYITINDIVVNGQRRPFEIFINCKDMSDFQWILALTRTMSAVFRSGGEAAFLIDEMKSVIDPKGGYFSKGSYVPSVVYEIGNILDEHLTEYCSYKKDTSLKKVVETHEEKNTHQQKMMQCKSCHEFAVVVREGCSVCLSCGYSKCE